MKILVLVQDYPIPKGKQSLVYVHVRNLYYLENEIDVDVLSFATKEDYTIDNINVYSHNSYKDTLKNKDYDLLICHAPNIRNHFRFLNLYQARFPKIVLFFHGHEVLNTNAVYSKPYSYQKNAPLVQKFISQIYDKFKLNIWHLYIPKILYKSHLVFVSNWMYDEFMKWVKIDSKKIEGKYSIIYNRIGDIFENENFLFNNKKKYDFITIRGFIDGSKYCVDIINNLAKQNPQYNFLLIGKGKYFEYNEKASNLEWINTHVNHHEIANYLNLSRCALMPTRTDAQGLMMCEMATFGIPVITSDISVCHEVFHTFENVRFINNNDEKINLDEMLKELENNLPYKKNEKYFALNTVEKELQLFKEL